MWDFIWNRFLATFYTISYTNTTWNLSMEQTLIRMLHANRAREPHVNPDSCTWHTQFLKENHQNSTWKSLHVSHNTSYSQICHKYIHIMGWKDQKRKQRQPVGSLFLLNSCCEQAATGMIRVFPVHFVPLQSTSTQCNIHDSRAATQNCMKCGISYETDFWSHFIQFLTQIQPEICQWSRD